MGKFDGLVDETLAERGVRTSASLTSAIDVQPDQAAAALAQSKRFGIPAAALGGRPDPDLGARATLEDNSAVIAKSPTLGSWLASNPTAMQIAQDDLPGLSAVDETVRVFTRGTRALAAGAYARLPEGLYGAGQAITEPLATADTDNLLLSPTGQLIQPLAAQLSRFFTWGRKGSAAEATRIEGDQSGAGTVEQAVYSGLQSVGVNIGPLALSVMTGNPTPALATMATVTGGSSYGRARDAGLEPVAALPYAINDAAIEYVTERIPLVSLLGELKAGSPFYRILADQMVKEGLTEQAATFLQDANAWAALNPEKTAAEFLAERPNAALQTAIATAVATGLQTGAVAGVQRIAQRREQKLAAAEDAQSRLIETLTELNTLAEASKVRERDVDTFESFVAEATKDGPVQDVFISADALMQSGVLDQVAALSPGVAQQFATAQATGGMVRIPLKEIVGRLGGETAKPLLDHLKTDPNGFSKAEADEYVKEHAEALKADVERELNRQGMDDEFNASRERVASGILAQLQSVNRFTEDVNKPYAAMVAARYATLAQQMGMTPEQVAQQYPLRIVGESVGGLEQPQAPQTDSPEFRNWFGDSKVADAAGKPLVVYHGTRGDFNVFNTQHPDGIQRHYFAADPATAAEYADDHTGRTGEGGNVMPAYLAIRNPAIIEADGSSFAGVQLSGVPAQIIDALPPEAVRRGYSTLSTIARVAESLGHDGLIVRNVRDGAGPYGEQNPGDVYIAFRPEQIKSATGNSGAFDPNNPDILNQSAFHGTPHTVDKFSLHKIGSGEGAQAYGWGLYFAGKRAVAEHYRKTLSDSTSATGAVFVGDQKVDAMSPEGHAARLLFYNDKAEMRSLSKQMLKEAKAGEPYTTETARHQGMDALEYYGRLDSFIRSHSRKDIRVIKGNLYQVELPEDDALVDNDAPISKQNSKVQGAARTFLRENGYLKDGEDGPRQLVAAFRAATMELGGMVKGPDGQAMYEMLSKKLGGDQAASQYLHEHGVPGMRYKAGQIAGVKGGGHNYVIWDEAAISEPTPLYQNRGGNRGAFDPQTRTLALLKAADLSTFLHEAGHFFLEIQAEIASQPNAPAAVSEDMDRILKWFGIEATPERTALDVWRGMTLNEQREHHEKFARGFEAYLFEGKAPNVAMRGVFQRFRAWMLNVYRELKNLNVQLNDEIRGVFDRMIASEQEIADAEAGRSMGMLFESAEEAAKFGVDWRQYHDQGLAATDQAVSELQAKSLGDMRWLTGARARLLKKMQREAERERRDVRATVRGEVLAQPVYRAWTFLSGKSDLPVKKKNIDVDPEKDSLFEAIRKLGGINKDELVSTWGTDPADLASENRVRTRQPLAPAKAGMTIDGMAEVLSEFGYLGTDEHGKWDLAQFEEKFDQELRGTKQWSFGVNPEIALGIFQETVNIDGLARGKLDTDELRETYGAGENAVWRKLVDMGMTSAKRGLPADGLAEQMGFTSGDEMITALVSAQDPATVIEAETDKRMLELHGDTYTPEGMALAVDEALHNAARTRMTATELSALEKAGNPRTPAGTDSRGRPRTQATLPAAAKAFAEQLIAKLTPRTLLPAQYAASAERARKAATKALKAGNVAEAALEKRNQLVNEYAAKAAHDARDELTRGLDYLKGFAKTSAAKRVDPDYLDQIHAILEKFDLRRAVTLKEIDKRKSLADWIAEQEELGIEPELPPHVRADALRVSYKELSLEQFRGVVDSVRQIEHLGKLKKKLLLARDTRELEQVLAELKVSIADNAPASEVENRTRNTAANRAVRLFTAFVASHRKVASLARQLDGFKDGGPMWEHFIRNMNERGDFEATRRAAATKALAALLAPVSKAGRMSGKGIFIKELGLSLNREERITVALNVGNAGNMQRLMDGRGWSQAGVSAVLDTLTKEEWDFVQGVWDHFETYRPEIAAKQRRVFGFEPEWVEPQPVLTKFGQLRGGYYPIVYDARESLAAESNEEAEQAQRQLKGAKVAATTRRTFTKNRAEAVKGRPLLLTMDGMFRGVNDVIHDLAWHEWIIDSNRILRGIDPTVRAKYGADVVRQFKDAVRDIAAGEQSDGNALNRVIGPLRTGASVAGLGFNLVNVALQGLGITQTIVRIGPKWTAKGVAAWVTSPRKLVGDVFERSEFMRNRARTLNREINELQSVVRDKNKAKARLDQVMFWPMQMFQMGVDMPTWWGAYQKALAEDTDDSRAVALADQAVIDAQGSGQVKDLAGIQRGPEVLKLFTVFYGFFSTTYNLAVERGKATKMTSPLQVARLAVDYLVLFSVPAVLGELLRQALAGGDDDEEKLAEKLAAAQVSYLMGTMVGVREASGAVQSALGIRQYAGGYGGPAGLRFLQELDKLGQQVGQGEFDRALVRTAVNVAGVTLHLPSAQINRTLDGVIALEEGKTDSPMALIGGVPAAQR